MSFIEDLRQFLSTQNDRQNEANASERNKYKYQNTYHAGQQNQMDYEAELDKLNEMKYTPFKYVADELRRGHIINPFDAIKDQQDVVDKYKQQNDIYTWNRLNREFGVDDNKEPTVWAEFRDEVKNGSGGTEGSSRRTPTSWEEYYEGDGGSSKSEEGLAGGQDGGTTPVEQKDTEETKAPVYDIDEMAGEFILGAWGNGQDRIDNMINAGYSLDDYNKIQQRVNDAYASGRDLHEWTNAAAHKLGYW